MAITASENSRYKSWLNRWGDPSQLTLLNYIGDQIHPGDILILGALLFPKIRKVEDCFVWEENLSMEVFQQMKQTFPAEEIEKDLNRVILFDLFSYQTEPIEDETFEQLANLIRQSWQGHLLREFPEANFTVEISDSDSDYGPSVTFFQKR